MIFTSEIRFSRPGKKGGCREIDSSKQGQNENFRRFNYRSEEKVYKEFMLYAIGRNIMKYHRFLHHEIEKYEEKKEQKTA